MAAARGKCVVHARARKLEYVLAGEKCAACERPLEKGDWVVGSEKAEKTWHVACPPRRPRRNDAPRKLLELADETR